MEALRIIISGIIEGLTQFLPVSSSGHQAVLRNILGFGADSSLIFDALLKLSAVLVIAVGFKKDIIRIAGALTHRKYGSYYHRLFVMIMVSTISTGIAGCMGRDFAAYALGTVIFPGMCLVITGVMLFLTDGIPRGTVTAENATFFSAFVIGGLQGLSVLPGLARCGMVAAACLLFGYDKKLTWKFTFLSALPPLAGAVILDIIDIVRFGADDAAYTGWYILASLLAVFTGYLGLMIVNKTLKKGSFKIFSIYCLVLGAFALASIIVM